MKEDIIMGGITPIGSPVVAPTVDDTKKHSSLNTIDNVQQGEMPRVENTEPQVNVNQPKAFNEQQVTAAIEQLNDFVSARQRDILFKVDDDAGRVVISVVDRESEEIIRQIPEELALRLAKNLKEHGDLILIKQQA
ncbi:flagellar protein FlaG [Zooshikella harenae]|uniref:Flagellar protein FlaG n=1 Tax=Zooshikella harenae TaxID=2827238 RepID=A0ABS5Z8W5_9GAMM|nr:flagellar protein FlaG [Zooshikella harenae]MBU2710486.1 flagellar protein FlaG [Zooshikella harenae]